MKSTPASRIPEPTVGGGGVGSCCVRSNCVRGKEDFLHLFSYKEMSHDRPCVFSHQLRLAPGDAVTGDAAEVTPSGDLDFGP